MAKASDKPHVIVGAGTAGLNAIRTLRQLGNTDPVVLVSAEPPYSRMVLPYFLEQRISESHVATANERQLAEWKVEHRFGVRAVGIDPQANTLHLDAGDPIEYADLMIATGSSAVRPPIPGADLPGVHAFWTFDDARGVHSTVDPDARAVMVGAGFISFTILNGVLKRAGKLTVVEVADRILPRMVDDAGAAIVEDWLRAKGVELRTGAKISKIETAGEGLELAFEQGDPLRADLVLMATGIRTNLEWLEGSGIEVNQGVLVDEQLRSSVPNVYAAGDVAEARNRITGEREVHAIEPTAMEHGRVVAANMAGQKLAYPGSLLMNIVGAAGLDMASFGSWDDPQAEAITGRVPERHAYRKYLFRNGRMTGAILIERSDATWSENEVGMLKGLVQSGVDLSDWREHLTQHPFELKKPFLATRATAALLPETVLGRPAPAPVSGI